MSHNSADRSYPAPLEGPDDDAPPVRSGVDTAAGSDTVEKEYKESFPRSRVCLISTIVPLIITIVALLIALPILWRQGSIRNTSSSASEPPAVILTPSPTQAISSAREPTHQPTLRPTTLGSTFTSILGSTSPNVLRSTAISSPTIMTTTLPTTNPSSAVAPTPNTSTTVSSYAVASGPFRGSVADNGLGAAVALDQNLAAAAAITTSDTDDGVVKAYRKLDVVWTQIQTIYAPNVTAESSTSFGGNQFGTSIGISSTTGMIIGAPGDSFLVTGRATKNVVAASGAAYVYQFSLQYNAWTQLGSTLYGTSVVESTSNAAPSSESFGAAVAITDDASRQWTVVGAPLRNDLNGAVYVFQYTNLGNGSSVMDWQAMRSGSQVKPVVEGSVNDVLGTSVDIAKDGSFFIAGAPGSGHVLLYRWSDSSNQWESYTRVDAPDSTEEFGSAVIFLARSGSIFAVGGPAYQDGRGVVRVYWITSFEAQQLGQDIVGDQGDSLGLTGTMSGTFSINGTTVLLGTASGIVKRFDYDVPSSSWIQRFNDVNSDFTAGVSGISANWDSSAFLVGSSSSDTITFYEAI